MVTHRNCLWALTWSASISATRKASSSDCEWFGRGSAGRLVAHRQVDLSDTARPAEALGDVVAGELDVQAAGVRAERATRMPPASDGSR